MQNEQSTEIIKRFILVINELIEVGVILNEGILERDISSKFVTHSLQSLSGKCRIVTFRCGKRYNPQMTDPKEERKKHPYFRLLVLPKNPVGRPNL